MKNLLLLCFTLMTFWAHGQYSNYNLNDYARPDLKRETLVLGLDGFASQLDRIDDEYESNYSFSTDGAYKGYFNNKKQQRNVAGSYIARYSKNLNFASGVDFSDTRRNYNNEDNDNYLLLGYSINNTIDNRDGDFTYINFSLTPEVQVGYGMGRIEFINDAWHAATIVEQLNNIGVGNIIDHDQLTTLAHKIGEIKNLRKLDFRNEFIAELETLSQSLIDVGFLDDIDIKAFAHLQDLYRYESFVTRRSGSRIEGSAIARSEMIDYNKNNVLDLQKELILGINLNYINAKAINMDWQREYSVGVQAERHFLDFSEYTSVAPYLEYDLGWLPNYRTYLNINANIYYNLMSKINDMNRETYGMGISAGYKYYLSPELRFNATATFSTAQRNGSYLDGNNLSNNIMFGVEYYMR